VSIARLLPGVPILRDMLDRVIAPTVLEPIGQDQGDLEWALARIKPRIEDVALLDGYYNGDHRIGFTATEKWRTQFGKLIKSLNANYCPAVVDAMVDRLRLANLSILADGDPDEELTDALSQTFRENRFDRRAGMMHALAARHGEAFLLIWPHPDTDRPAYYPHDAAHMVARYDPERPLEIDVAAKVWMDGRRCRVTLYYRDRIERWATKSNYSGIPVNAKGFTLYDEDGEPDIFANPYGRVPIVPFLNNTVDGMAGRSELIDVIPIQDLLNKSIADMFVSMEFAGFPQRWATGLAGEEKDPITGESLYPFVAGVERMFTSDSPDTAFGQFQSADLAAFVTVQDSVRSDIARVSRTPIHYLLLTGAFPSGEALHVADAPLRAKIADRQDEHGGSWEDVALLSAVVAGAIRPEGLEPYSAEATWRDTDPSGAQSRATYATALRADLDSSEAEAWRTLGWDDAKIEQVRAEREEEGLEAQAAPSDEGGGEAGVAAIATGPSE
jgi:hypothetical protein